MGVDITIEDEDGNELGGWHTTNEGEHIPYTDTLAGKLAVLSGVMRGNSERWFPELHNGSVPLTQFYALGLAGEAGEVANEAKKLWRNIDGDREKLALEIADTFTYLILLAYEEDIDIIATLAQKIRINEARWGNGQTNSPR